jgi:hypothetical protein
VPEVRRRTSNRRSKSASSFDELDLEVRMRRAWIGTLGGATYLGNDIDTALDLLNSLRDMLFPWET